MDAIFIGGCPRSGTTMLGSLLQCIPGAGVTNESRFKSEILWNAFPDKAEFKARIFADRLFRTWNVPADHCVDLTSEREFYGSIVAGALGRPCAVWVDHSPHNIKEYERLKALFPAAKFIHLVRDGRAVANSLMQLEWGPNTPAAAARFWTREVAIGLARQAMCPEDVLMVRYEDLVRDVVTTMNRILRHVGSSQVIDSVDDLRPDASFLPEAFKSEQHSNIGKLPDPRMIDKWSVDLNAEAVRQFEHYAGDLLEALGYARRQGRTKPSKVALAKAMVDEKWRAIVINPRKYRKKRRVR